VYAKLNDELSNTDTTLQVSHWWFSIPLESDTLLPSHQIALQSPKGQHWYSSCAQLSTVTPLHRCAKYITLYAATKVIANHSWPVLTTYLHVLPRSFSNAPPSTTYPGGIFKPISWAAREQTLFSLCSVHVGPSSV